MPTVPEEQRVFSFRVMLKMEGVYMSWTLISTYKPTRRYSQKTKIHISWEASGILRIVSHIYCLFALCRVIGIWVRSWRQTSILVGTVHKAWRWTALSHSPRSDTGGTRVHPYEIIERCETGLHGDLLDTLNWITLAAIKMPTNFSLRLV
jgi:hypothetical protein